MPRPMLHSEKSVKIDTSLNLGLHNETKVDTKKATMLQERLLRKKRSKEYMNALSKLDVGGHVHNQAVINEIRNAIREEFPDIDIFGHLIGIVALCYLGEPYEVHTLDLTNNIVEHYERGQSLPQGMERARGLVLHGNYEYIEVYNDCCRAISTNGDVSVIAV